ncbi:putative ubiquinone biosynthesis protein coq-8 [Drepanopeziza brunnea f. sp. 'multigermtubi' MB_m1]|uniref:Putative ubiquinone biosynthesis protein coq-8 n=1 Tax=Marssonina brunnea f. sp. multigermtubi (strain MB_m1) TaxID=1072389 RepID=K1XM26_MARBU|nr:putative ubiquinone biosynthesis protein coq-8 [Drepanopeziza brunnea f. sp. 'multigermtubi' MB_m1]EKD13534.1 putative ubiquinone biosynthesis protein coq-8 [Drepanopeziza brunnea f. sp. 'multigermtubi' MB_m1]
MAGKRLLDIAALFSASRGVAQKHVALRSRQLDVYNRTSTLARAARSQTDRVTETVKAASFLASRLNEDAPEWASQSPDSTSSKGEQAALPGKQTTTVSPRTGTRSDTEQDNVHEKYAANSAVDAAPEGQLEIKQKSASRYPLPDGTIPQEDTALSKPAIDHDTLPTRPVDELGKEPLHNEGITPVSSDGSSILMPEGPGANTTYVTQIPSSTADAMDSSTKGPLEDDHGEDSFYRKSKHNPSLPKVELPRHTSTTQEGSPQLPLGQLNSDSYYNTSSNAGEEYPPEGVNTDLFLSPRVARMLGGDTHTAGILSKKTNLDIPAPGIHPVTLENQKLKDDSNARQASSAAGNGIKAAGQIGQMDQDVEQLARSNAAESLDTPNLTPHELRESKVPSSRLGRLLNYGGLAAGMFGGAISESLRRVGGGGGEGSYMLSEANMERLVSKLSRMRGAALKLGQVISFQDSKMLPAPIQQVLQRVQDRADYMPPSQRDKVLTTNLGLDWKELFSSFEEKPIAAASIGQVHSAVLKSNGARVAVKIQYPGVAESIDSDLNNLGLLLTASRLLPKGLFLDKTIANARIELAWECDYVREAESGRRFKRLLADDEEVFLVPKVYSEASGKQVLTTEFMDGIGVTRAQSFTQDQKDWIGTQILRLCLREITEFRFMQTDPNWTNFLYNSKTNKLELLDFGASREYPEFFITRYTQLLAAASRSDKKEVEALSIDLGYLTGQESKAMLDAHIASILTLAEPFLDSSPEVYDFKDQTITERVKGLIPLMIRERLAPPPEETYSLHRKLSGAFLLCARLGSRVRCRELFENSMKTANLL